MFLNAELLLFMIHYSKNGGKKYDIAQGTSSYTSWYGYEDWRCWANHRIFIKCVVWLKKTSKGKRISVSVFQPLAMRPPPRDQLRFFFNHLRSIFNLPAMRAPPQPAAIYLELMSGFSAIYFIPTLSTCNIISCNMFFINRSTSCVISTINPGFTVRNVFYAKNYYFVLND